MKSKIFLISILYLFIGISCLQAKSVVLLLDDANYGTSRKFIDKIKINEEIPFYCFSVSHLRNKPECQKKVFDADIILIDVMISELIDFVRENNLLKGRKVYALGGSRNNDKLKQDGFIFDVELKKYFINANHQNIQSMIHKTANDNFGLKLKVEKPVMLPPKGIYHPDAEKIFLTLNEYLEWEKKNKKFSPESPRVGILFYRSYVNENSVPEVDYFVRRFEKEGIKVLPVFGYGHKVITDLMFTHSASGESKPAVDFLISYLFKFQSGISPELNEALIKLNVPVMDIIKLYYSEIAEWEKNVQGLQPLAVSFCVSVPEISGLCEPTVTTGRHDVFDVNLGLKFQEYAPIIENCERIVSRVKKWINLQRKPNKDKKVVLMFYNNSQGKQNIGASYLNVFRSIEQIIKAMKAQGYTIEGNKKLDEKSIRDLILKYARNIGSWAPGELDKLVAENKCEKIDMQTYIQWFKKLPQGFKKEFSKQWGEPQNSKIMIKDRKFIMPILQLGNLVLMPEPSRGWGDDPQKLYHSPVVYPHHQYIAAYLWMKHIFHADVQIHLGTHGTHEWLPGKQCGLSHNCPPEVLITDIPSIYPYIVDDIGEGIQAKRRGRAVVIDHLTPAIKRGGLHNEYSELNEKISKFRTKANIDKKLAETQFADIRKMVKKLGIGNDLKLTDPQPTDIVKIENYLKELKTSFMPYGIHTFGVSPEGEALEETLNNVFEFNKDVDKGEIRENFNISGPNELKNLLKGMNGEFVPPGEGNDPIRNPEAVPTGLNFFGFDPKKIPSPAAYELGKQAAEKLIAQKKTKDGKIAVVLWAVETIRNEGVNEATILYLMGLKPAWDKTGRVKGTEVIPASMLQRPRYDVVICASGLYRDMFPAMLIFLDQAIQKAAVLNDVENLIHQNSLDLEQKLISKGIPANKAKTLSRIRIFSEKPGSYGTGVADLAPMSGIWEQDSEVGDVFMNRMGFAFGENIWGENSRELLVENLKKVDTTVHSIASNVYGTMDNDDMFQYLGGLSLAVRTASGKSPDTMVTLNRATNGLSIENISKTVGREFRVRYTNPKWIEGMKKENYAGAREISKFMDFFWGWQVTVPDAVSEAQWQQVYEVYVEDKYGQDIKKFFNKHNPWAYQSITARMLEAVRKDYWQADEKVKQKLAAEYAMNVVEKGVACCDHTCNNPALNQMVVNIISLPGVMSPEIVKKFKVAIEQMAGKKLDQQIKERQSLQQKLQNGFKRKTDVKKLSEIADKIASQKQKEKAKKKGKKIKGYKMKKIEKKDDDSKLSSSGIQWFVSLIVLTLIAIFFLGMRKKV